MWTAHTLQNIVFRLAWSVHAFQSIIFTMVWRLHTLQSIVYTLFGASIKSIIFTIMWSFHNLYLQYEGASMSSKHHICNVLEPSQPILTMFWSLHIIQHVVLRIFFWSLHALQGNAFTKVSTLYAIQRIMFTLLWSLHTIHLQQNGGSIASKVFYLQCFRASMPFKTLHLLYFDASITSKI